MIFLKTLEAFIHSGYNTIHEVIDLRDYDFLYHQSKESVIKINKLLRKNEDKLIRLFHGTSPNLPIQEEGLKTSKIKTKKSLQSEVGYVYLSIYPESAKIFGEMSNNTKNSVVYEIEIPITHLKPDKDQLYNKRKSYVEFNTREKVPIIRETLGDSAIYGNGFRVKGDIPPYMIKKYNFPG